jgi:hypothetical protein
VRNPDGERKSRNKHEKLSFHYSGLEGSCCKVHPNAFEEVTLDQCRPHDLEGEFQTWDTRDPRPPELPILPHIAPSDVRPPGLLVVRAVLASNPLAEAVNCRLQNADSGVLRIGLNPGGMTPAILGNRPLIWLRPPVFRVFRKTVGILVTVLVELMAGALTEYRV